MRCFLLLLWIKLKLLRAFSCICLIIKSKNKQQSYVTMSHAIKNLLSFDMYLHLKHLTVLHPSVIRNMFQLHLNRSIRAVFKAKTSDSVWMHKHFVTCHWSKRMEYKQKWIFNKKFNLCDWSYIYKSIDVDDRNKCIDLHSAFITHGEQSAKHNCWWIIVFCWRNVRNILRNWQNFHWKYQFYYVSLVAIKNTRQTKLYELKTGNWIVSTTATAAVEAKINKFSNVNNLILISIFGFFVAGKGNPVERIKCSRSEMPGHRLRRCPWSIPRPHGIISNRRTIARYKLPVHGRLCGSWVLFRRNSNTFSGAQSTLSRTNHNFARQPRVPPDHPSLWILRWMFAQIW